MKQSRRVFLRSGALAFPALVCAAVASATERRDDSVLPDGSASGDILAGNGRVTCPLCTADRACPQHLI